MRSTDNADVILIKLSAGVSEVSPPSRSLSTISTISDLNKWNYSSNEDKQCCIKCSSLECCWSELKEGKDWFSNLPLRNWWHTSARRITQSKPASGENIQVKFREGGWGLPQLRTGVADGVWSAEREVTIYDQTMATGIMWHNQAIYWCVPHFFVLC